MYPLKLVTPPTEQPLTLDDVKTHLRVDGTSEDTLLTALLQAAVQHVQNVTNRQLMRATYQLSIPDGLPKTIVLPRPPFAEVTSITAVSSAGPAGTFALGSDFTVSEEEYATVTGIADSFWFSETYTDAKVVYTAGYATAADVPGPIKEAIKLLLTYLYENRGDANKPMPAAIDVLLGSYRIFSF